MTIHALWVINKAGGLVFSRSYSGQLSRQGYPPSSPLRQIYYNKTTRGEWHVWATLTCRHPPAPPTQHDPHPRRDITRHPRNHLETHARPAECRISRGIGFVRSGGVGR